MPLDPSIISSYNPTPGVDVNALMTQRMQGMANINAMERQRQADALALEDRAAEQQKAQEAEAIQALSPAVAAAFEDPSDAGLDAAFSMVPEQYREAADQQLAQLRAIPDLNRRKSIIRSALLQDDYGRALLAQIEPTANMRLQADTAANAQALQQRRLELDIAAAEREAAAGPEASYTPVKGPDGKVYLMNSKTGEMKSPTVNDGADINAGAALPEGMDAKTKVKFDQAYPKSASSLRTAVTGMDNTLTALKKLIEDPGLEMISGTVGAYTPNLNKDAKRAQALFDQIKAGAGLAALVELKQASPSGGALGNVSNQEGATLRDSRGAFLQTQEYEDLRNALIDYYNVLERSKANVISAFDDTYFYRGEGAAESILQSAQEQFGEIEERTKQKFKTKLPAGVTVKKNN